MGKDRDSEKDQEPVFSMLLCRQDYFSLYKRLFLECGFPFEEKIDWRRPFIIGIKESKILSMNPSSLDFPRKYPPNCQYAPSRVDLNREDPMLNRRYARVMEEVCLQKQQRPDTKIIYCFSSTVMGFEKRSKIHFHENKGYLLTKSSIRFHTICREVS